MLPKHIIHVFLSLDIECIFTNSADPDELLYLVAFHLSLHSLQLYLFPQRGYPLLLYGDGDNALSCLYQQALGSMCGSRGGTGVRTLPLQSQKYRVY